MKKEKKKEKRCLHRNVYYDTFLKVEVCADCGATPPTFTLMGNYAYDSFKSAVWGRPEFIETYDQKTKENF